MQINFSNQILLNYLLAIAVSILEHAGGCDAANAASLTRGPYGPLDPPGHRYCCSSGSIQLRVYSHSFTGVDVISISISWMSCLVFTLNSYNGQYSLIVAIITL